MRNKTLNVTLSRKSKSVKIESTSEVRLPIGKV